MQTFKAYRTFEDNRVVTSRFVDMALDDLDPTHLRRLRPMYHGIGKAAPIYIQVAFANGVAIWPAAEALLVPNPEMNASMRTTTALTIINGGVEDNTIPAEARAIVNFRLLPGDTIADVLWHAKKVIKDERVKFKPVEGKFNEALPISPQNSPAYDGLRLVIRQVFDNPPVAPYVMLGGTDCQHFVPVCDHIYRFTSLVMDESFRGLEHGIDERNSLQLPGVVAVGNCRMLRVLETRRYSSRTPRTGVSAPSPCDCSSPAECGDGLIRAPETEQRDAGMLPRSYLSHR